jgi:hypothetical protein
LKSLEQRTSIPKAYLVLSSVSLLLFLHAFNSLAAPVSNILGWVLPAYFSLKALETPSPQDDIQWLTYWVIFGFFNLFETLALRVILYYFSWYFAFKSLFVLWLQLPAFRVRNFLFRLLPNRASSLFFRVLNSPMPLSSGLSSRPSTRRPSSSPSPRPPPLNPPTTLIKREWVWSVEAR